MQARVSILLPAFDAEATLAVCLRSIVRQREERWECVLVDDGSRDATLAIAQAFAARDPRFRLVSLQHGGLISALGHGLEYCTAPVVARMDADDWMHRDRLAIQLSWLEEHPQLAGVGSHVRMFPRSAAPGGRRDYEAWLGAISSSAEVRAEAFVECPIAHPTLTLRRELLQRFGYRDRQWPEDYDLVLRLLTAGHELAVVPRRLLGWRDHSGRLSRTHPRYELDRFTACKAEHLASSFLANHDSYILWGYGDTGRALQRALRKHRKAPALIVELHPRRIGQNIQGAEVISPEQLANAPRLPIITSVSGADARTKIRTWLNKLGKRELADFVCAA